MKKNILILITVIFSIILEISFLPSFFSFQYIPSLTLIIVILFSIQGGFEKNWKWVFGAGIIFDFLSFGRLGAHAFSFLLISLLTSFFSEKFFISQKLWSFTILIIFIFIVSVLNDFMVVIFNQSEYFLKGRYFGSIGFLENSIFFRALYNMIAGVIIYKPIIRLQTALKLSK